MGKRIFPLIVAAALGLGALTAPAAAQSGAHQTVRQNLAYLTMSGAPTDGENIGQPAGVQSQATGFFVGNEGFILTSEHFFDPIRKAAATNLVIEAQLGGPGGQMFPVSFVSALPDVDLVLLRANVPFGTAAPPGLTIGNTALLEPEDDRDFLTSGFNGEDYVPDAGKLIERGNRQVPFAWTLKLTVGGGQSGSPVYIVGDAGQVEVVGVVKASTGQNHDRTLIVPIEYAMPLIGHFKIDALERENTALEAKNTDLKKEVDGMKARVDWLVGVVGDISNGKPPIGKRIDFIENDVDQIGRYFRWSAEAAPDGSLRIRYDKLVGGDEQIDRIDVNLVGKMLVRTDGTAEPVQQPTPALRLNNNGNVFDRSRLDDKHLKGEFVVPNVLDKLLQQLNSTDNIVGGEKPFATLELSFVPFIGTEQLEIVKLGVAPNYVFNVSN